MCPPLMILLQCVVNVLPFLLGLTHDFPLSGYVEIHYDGLEKCVVFEIFDLTTKKQTFQLYGWFWQ